MATGSVVPGTIGTPAAFISSRARVLEPIASIALRRRPDEGDPGVLARLGERRVLGQEAVAGVHGLGAGLAAHLEDALDVEVALGRRRAAQQVGLVGARDVQRVAIELGVDRHRGDAHLAQRADDADRDLAAVGDQDLLEHAIDSLVERKFGARPAFGPHMRSYVVLAAVLAGLLIAPSAQAAALFKSANVTELGTLPEAVGAIGARFSPDGEHDVRHERHRPGHLRRQPSPRPRSA